VWEIEGLPVGCDAQYTVRKGGGARADVPERVRPRLSPAPA
jgi:hypothetical protein